MRFLALSLFFFCAAFGHAEDARKVRCRFLCFEGAEPPSPLVNVSDKGVEIACKIPVNELSPVTVCSAKSGSISFLTSKDLKPAANATIPANMTAAMLVFAAAEKAPSALPWRVFVIEDFAMSFPDGGALVANFCNQDVRFVIDEDDITLHSGKVHICVRPTHRDAFNMAPVLCQFQQDDHWRTVSESLMRFASGMRYLICAYPDPASGRPLLTTLQDFPAAKAGRQK